MTDPNCIFCKIASGQIPALRVAEDDAMFAFLDIGPLAEGHLLVIPKNHYASLTDMPASECAAVAQHFPRLSQAVLKATGLAGCNVLLNSGKSAGQEVMHLHWHIIPRIPGDGLGYRWKPQQYTAGRGEAIQREILEALKSG